MSHFIRSGNTYRVFAGDALDISENLPAGNYALKFSQFEGFYLETVSEFKLPAKVYGDNPRHAGRIINTFRGREGNTGVMLVGEKGSGKTLLARQIAIESGLPVIVVSSAYSGENFNSFLSSISQPCIVFLDEFEKMFDKDAQEKLLTLLDGTYQSKKLFLLTSNNKWRLDDHMKNRPGRIFYLIEFDGLEEEFIREYCEDCLVNKTYISSIIEISKRFDSFNFDLLSSIVEESNRYGEDPKDFMYILNAKPEYAGKMEYRVQVEMGGELVPAKSVSNKSVCINPSVDDFSINICLAWDNSDEEVEGMLNADDESIDWSTVVDWMKEGRVALYYSGSKDKPFEDIDWSWCEIYSSYNDIVKYEGTNTTVYSPDPGILVKLTKDTTKKKTKGRSRLVDFLD